MNNEASRSRFPVTIPSDEATATGGPLFSGGSAAAAIGPGQDQTHYAWLDGIRGLAAVVVVFGHCSNFGINVIPGLDLTATAKAGVWLFFMLSAYLLVGKMVGQLQGGMSAARIVFAYAVRRLLRIMPLYLLLLTLLGILNYQSYFDWDAVLRHAVLLEGWQHFWTIPVEMKFYALVPILALMLAAAPVSMRLGTAFALLLAAVVAYLHAPYPRIAGNPLPLQGYLIFFMLGVVVQLAVERRPLRRPMAWAVGGVLAAILSHPRLIAEVSGVAMERTLELYPVFAFAVAIAMLASAQDGRLQAWLKAPPLVFVGKISFGLYLTHYFVLPLVVQLTWLAALRGVVAVAASLGVAWFCYVWIERPFLLLGGRIADRILFRAATMVDTGRQL